MKKIFLFIISIALLGCSDDFLERASLTQIAENNFWQSESDAFLALNAAYASLQPGQYYGGNINGWQGIPNYDCFSDNAYNQYKWEGQTPFMEGTYKVSDGKVDAMWNISYQGINRVNAIIKNVELASENLISAETKKSLAGQAYFLRALFYFNLAMYYEEAPLITEPQTLKEAYVSKNSYEELIANIKSDLIKAVDGLPEAQPSELYGYATKGAALGLFARVQLYEGTYDGPNGVLDLTNQLMGLGYSLHPDYASLFTPENERSNEIVFSVRFERGDDSNNGEKFSATYLGSPKVDQRPMPNLVDDYYCTDGLPITESSLYDANNKGLNRDPRANATIYFKGEQYIDDPVKVFPGNGPTKFGQRKYIRRGADAEGNNPWEQGSQDFYVIRYADVLLMRAEALAETGDIPGATALVNQIRARVNMPTVESVEGSVDQATMIDIVRHERRVELALEGLRFMDLKRWGEMEAAIQRATADPVGPYNPVYLGKKRSEIFPVPQTEIDVNKNLTQHPAWL